MKTTKMMKWYWENTYLGLVIMYGVLVGVVVLLTTIFSMAPVDGEVHFQSVEISSSVMLFVMMLVFFPQGLRFALGNGTARKTVFLSMISFTLVISLFVNILNVGFERMVSLLSITSTSVLELIYPTQSFAAFMGVFFARWCATVCMAFVGFFIGGAYYRMGKLTKVLVSVLVPCAFVFGIPFFIAYAPQSWVMGVLNFLRNLAAYLQPSAYRAGMLMLAIGAVFGGASWLFLRKAPLKTA